MKNFLLLLSILVFVSCQPNSPTADLILKNGTVYTVDSVNSIAEAVAIKDGKILYVGSDDEIQAYQSADSEIINLRGKFVYPGFIEGHAHIMGIGENLLNVDLRGAQSYEEVVLAVKQRALQTPKGKWIIGRGWHQDKWESQPEMISGFPTHELLSKEVPDHPVYLEHASGHAALINLKAMQLASLTKDTQDPAGGQLYRFPSGEPTGLLNETAQNLVSKIFPERDIERDRNALRLAIKECLQNGITGFHQAGSGESHIELFREFLSKDSLRLRLYVMLTGSDPMLLEKYFRRGPILDSLDRLNIRSVKLYSDGALGSRGAWLLDTYHDAHDQHGHNVTPLDEIKSITERASSAGFQVCTHAIGDRANREVLNIYEEVVDQMDLLDHRFRIEHAQHLHPDDIPRFAELGVLPAMQAIHMSSDRPWAIDRLGKKRIEDGAYVWRSLLDSGAIIVNGTDAPVEPINPLASLYASVSRKTLEGKPENGYEPEQKMTREEALRSYTINAAYGSFQEDLKGSIEIGKYADFSIIDKDIMAVPEAEILKAQVVKTIVGGKVLYSKD